MLFRSREEKRLPSWCSLYEGNTGGYLQPDISLYEEGKMVGVIEICHTNPKTVDEIEYFEKEFDGFFFEWKAKDVLQNLESSFEFFHKTIYKKCEHCEKLLEEEKEKRRLLRVEEERLNAISKEQEQMEREMREEKERQRKEEERQKIQERMRLWREESEREENRKWIQVKTEDETFFSQSPEWLREISVRTEMMFKMKEERFWAAADKATIESRLVDSRKRANAVPSKESPIKRKNIREGFEEACDKFAEEGW